MTTISKPDAGEELVSLSLPELEAMLGTTPDGLRQAEVQQRLEQYGYNEISEKKVNPFLKFLTYFWGPIPWMIEVAAILSALVRHWPDFCIILVLLLANAGVGFWEEYQAGNAIAALKARLALRARVRRDAQWTSVPARELVPGDIIRVRLGDIVPADARLLEGDPVEVDQSASGAFRMVSTGHDHSCGVSVTGSVWCWGGNLYGQLGAATAGNCSSSARIGS